MVAAELPFYGEKPKSVGSSLPFTYSLEPPTFFLLEAPRILPLVPTLEAIWFIFPPKRAPTGLRAFAALLEEQRHAPDFVVC